MDQSERIGDNSAEESAQCNTCVERGNVNRRGHINSLGHVAFGQCNDMDLQTGYTHKA
ncbi:hypothetical protein D3C71_1831030 [compost metagenome]